MKAILFIIFIFILIFFTGDEIMFLLSILASRGFFGISLVFFIAIASNLTSDILLFLFGKKILDKFKYKKLKKYKEISKNLLKKLKPERVLFLSKFIYGTRIITVITLGMSMKLKKFIFYDFLSLLPLTILVILFGWLSGKGIDLFYIYKPLIILPLLILIIFIIFKKCLNKKFVQLFLRTKKKKE